MSDNNDRQVMDHKIRHSFADVCINKALLKKVGVLGRSIPAFVSDWLVSRYSNGDNVDTHKIKTFLERHLPDKQQKQVILNRLVNGEKLKILDSYSVRVDIQSGARILTIPCLDISNARVRETIIDNHPLLLLGNVWGSGTLLRITDSEDHNKGNVWMERFVPMQTSRVDLNYFIEQRSRFTLDEWRALLVRSMGYNPDAYNERQQMLLLTRLCPMVHSRVNLIEFAPKGTGKSYIYSQLSRQSWLIGGGTVTRAQLFYNMSRKSAGVISKYDVVVFDEVQSIKLSNPGEICSALKGYLEYGKTNVMSYEINGDAGFVLLANIPIGEDGKPSGKNFFEKMPDWLHGQQATALLDRFHGLVPGWELPRITEETIGMGTALKADYFGEILHSFRSRVEYDFFVNEHTRTSGDIRDYKAIKKIATSLLKLLFPDLSLVTLQLFDEYCLKPAIELRGNVKRQLSILDPEFSYKVARIGLK